MMRQLNWEEFVSLCDRLSEKLRRERFDLIVAINQGGLVLGRILADKLGVKLAVISAQRYENGEKKQKIVCDYTISSLNAVEGRLLLVDAVTNTGEMLKTVTDFLRTYYKPASIKTAVLFSKDNGGRADFYGESENGWIVFPYEKAEFLRALAAERAKSLPQAAS